MRYALGIEYDGSEFAGWQQLGESGKPTVQAALEKALSTVANSPINVVGAGRTDARVHGQCQVAHFDTDVVRSDRSWMLGTTAYLPESVSVRWCVPVADDFHARFSALARRYRYRILNRQMRPALHRQTLTWVRQPLDAQAMHRAAQALLGENDFSAFRAAHCQARHAMRCIHNINVHREGEMVLVEVQANAFLYHMVRNIVGSLLLVGTGEQPEEWMAQLLASKDRTLAGPTAAPQGLVLIAPLYPHQSGLPEEVLWI